MKYLMRSESFKRSIGRTDSIMSMRMNGTRLSYDFRNTTCTALIFIFTLFGIPVQAQNFWPAEPLAQVEFFGNLFPDLADFDGDGDLDIVGIIKSQNDQFRLPFLMENTGTTQEFNFDEIKLNEINLQLSFNNEPLLVDLEDIDNDGDLDLMCMRYTIGVSELELYYYENLGSNIFAEEDLLFSGVENTAFFVNDAELADLDQDGDLDFLTMGFDLELFLNTGTNYISLFFSENVGTASNPIWKDPVANPNDFEAIEFVGGSLILINQLEASDFDGDGDLDILYSPIINQNANVIMMYSENKEDGFSTPRQISGLTNINGIASMATGDLDGDGDIDILFDNRETINDIGFDYSNLFWLENKAIQLSKSEDLISNNISLIENPISNELKLNVSEAGIYNFQIFDANGQLVQRKTHFVHAQNLQLSINTNKLQTGMYFLHSLTSDGKQVLKFVIQD